MWFKNKRDEGIMFSDYFNPISIPSIALILTAVSCPFVTYVIRMLNIVLRLNVISKSGLLESRLI
jgi:hypothetical protein